jgi:hypothetical protein
MPGTKPQERHRNGNAGQAGALFGEYNLAHSLRFVLSARTSALVKTSTSVTVDLSAPRQTLRH